MSRNDAWLSFYLQLYPHISWGLVTTCMQPKKLDTHVQCIYAKAPSFLGVNGNIKKEWRSSPEQYEGLGMSNIPLAALAEKLSFLVGNPGFHGQAHSDSLAMAYDNFLMEVGLYGSPLKWSCEEYSHLATYTPWFQNLWQLVHIFKSFGNNNQWDNMMVDGDGKWICNGIVGGTLVIAHDRSYGFQVSRVMLSRGDYVLQRYQTMA
jgi:hypothetical protein